MVYRAYSRRPDGRLQGRYGFAAPNDRAALRHARRYLDEGSCDVWQGPRHIGTLTPSPGLDAERVRELVAA